MKLVFSRRALRRLQEISDYIHVHNPSAALRVRAQLQAACELISRRPYIGRAFPDRVRRLVVPRLPYVILYRVDADLDEVSIVTVRHGAQQEEP